MQLKLIGTKSNRSATGAAAPLTSAGGTHWQAVHSGSSYWSASDLALTFGLGKDESTAAIEIEWPNGVRQKLTNVAAAKRLVIQEPCPAYWRYPAPRRAVSFARVLSLRQSCSKPT